MSGKARAFVARTLHLHPVEASAAVAGIARLHRRGCGPEAIANWFADDDLPGMDAEFVRAVIDRL